MTSEQAKVRVIASAKTWIEGEAVQQLEGTARLPGMRAAIGMPDLLEVAPGKTFTVVSGLGGKSIRAWDSGIHQSDTWWGTLFTSNYYRKNGVDMKKTSADEGALFMRFNVGGDPSAAEGYFKNVNGEIIDEFDIVRK